MKRIWIAVPLLLAGCATSATGPTERRFSGYYSSGFETESFRPCGSTESWWVTDAPALRAAYPEAATRPYEEVYVVVRGEVGPEGKHGHLGAYDRELLVTEVVEIRAARQGDCK